MVVFLEAETVVCLNENNKNSLKVLQLSRKTPVLPCQCWGIMVQIRVDTFHIMPLILVTPFYGPSHLSPPMLYRVRIRISVYRSSFSGARPFSK